MTALSFGDYILTEHLIKENEELQRELEACRNELCQRCGRYVEPLRGACKGCRWDTEAGGNRRGGRGMTNGDKLRTMTDEEFIKFECSITACIYEADPDKQRSECHDFDCERCWRAWLKEEAE